MDYEIDDEIRFKSRESFSATILDKVASRIYYAQLVDGRQVVLYSFSDKASAIFFIDTFKTIVNPTFKNDYVLGSINSNWFVTTELPISNTFHYWAAMIANPFVTSPYMDRSIDIIDEVKVVLRGVAEALWELLQMGFSYGVPLHTMRISPDGKPIMLAAFRPQDERCCLEDIDQFYTIVRDIVSDQGDLPEVIYNFQNLYFKSRTFHSKRKFAHSFYQNPLIFTKSDREKYICDVDLAMFKNMNIAKTYLNLDNTSMLGWQYRIPPTEPWFLFKYNHPKKRGAYTETKSFVHFRRSLSKHIEGPTDMLRLDVEDRWHLIFPESCSVIFNAVMDVIQLEAVRLMPFYMTHHIPSLVDKSKSVTEDHGILMKIRPGSGEETGGGTVTHEKRNH